MTSKHTPTPWDVHEFGSFDTFEIHPAQDENGEIVIADLGDDTEGPATTREANAECIVRACNSHDELVEACKALCDELHNGRKYDVKKDFSLLLADSAARKAIAKATQ